jgi:hypothetical protein
MAINWTRSLVLQRFLPPPLVLELCSISLHSYPLGGMTEVTLTEKHNATTKTYAHTCTIAGGTYQQPPNASSRTSGSSLVHTYAIRYIATGVWWLVHPNAIRYVARAVLWLVPDPPDYLVPVRCVEMALVLHVSTSPVTHSRECVGPSLLWLIVVPMMTTSWQHQLRSKILTPAVKSHPMSPSNAILVSSCYFIRVLCFSGLKVRCCSDGDFSIAIETGEDRVSEDGTVVAIIVSRTFVSVRAGLASYGDLCMSHANGFLRNSTF